MPNGTIVTLESVEVQTSDGHTWYNACYRYEDDAKQDEIGWADSDYLEGVGPDGFRRKGWGYVGQQYEVKTGQGLNLRWEPTTKPTTEDGKKNVILSMPNGTIVTLESVYVVDTSDGHTWYNVRYKYEDGDKNDEIGWAASNYLEGVGLGGSTEYTFEFSGKNYKITEPNLSSAKPTYIFTSAKGNSKKITINGTDYWTTSENIKAMKDPSKKLIT